MSQSRRFAGLGGGQRAVLRPTLEPTPSVIAAMRQLAQPLNSHKLCPKIEYSNKLDVCAVLVRQVSRPEVTVMFTDQFPTHGFAVHLTQITGARGCPLALSTMKETPVTSYQA